MGFRSCSAMELQPAPEYRAVTLVQPRGGSSQDGRAGSPTRRYARNQYLEEAKACNSMRQVSI